LQKVEKYQKNNKKLKIENQPKNRKFSPYELGHFYSASSLVMNEIVMSKEERGRREGKKRRKEGGGGGRGDEKEEDICFRVHPAVLALASSFGGARKSQVAINRYLMDSTAGGLWPPEVVFSAPILRTLCLNV
jgi:hypothetical protein